MSLIAVIAAIVGFNITAIIGEQRFKSASESILSQLKLAQSLMVIQGSDLSVTLKKEGSQGVKITIEMERSPSLALERLLKKESLVTGIQSMSFIVDEQSAADENITIEFSALKRTVTRGTIVLSAYDQADIEGPLRAVIPISGYPKPLQLFYEESTQRKREEDFSEESDELYPPSVKEMRAIQAEKEKQKDEKKETVSSP